MMMPLNDCNDCRYKLNEMCRNTKITPSECKGKKGIYFEYDYKKYYKINEICENCGNSYLLIPKKIRSVDERKFFCEVCGWKMN
ncbi:MAG: hypothetical protein ACFFDN_01420 [Candidatus Hodarchaeota archaeon]